jgi:hypothetical protein
VARVEAAAGQRLASQDAQHHDAMRKLREEHAEQAQRSRRQAEEEHQRQLEHARTQVASAAALSAKLQQGGGVTKWRRAHDNLEDGIGDLLRVLETHMQSEAQRGSHCSCNSSSGRRCIVAMRQLLSAHSASLTMRDDGGSRGLDAAARVHQAGGALSRIDDSLNSSHDSGAWRVVFNNEVYHF